LALKHQIPVADKAEEEAGENWGRGRNPLKVVTHWRNSDFKWARWLGSDDGLSSSFAAFYD
ncbi:MAG: hypothetical protein QGI86_28610, partial [Candidatus Poribacteria bacterium]|nr:hypothetical protein [Candidatus Poribacteria bacterium]